MLVGSRAPPQVIFKRCDTVKALVGGGGGGAPWGSRRLCQQFFSDRGWEAMMKYAVMPSFLLLG